MIYFLSLLCSLCINFGVVTLPLDYSLQNEYFSTISDTVYQAAGVNVDKQYCIICMNQSAGSYELFYPSEAVGNGNSTITLVNRYFSNNDTFLNFSTSLSNWRVVKLGSNYNYLYNDPISSLSALAVVDTSNFNINNQICIYNSYYNLPYQDIDTFSFHVSSVVDFEGHASGWGDTLEEVDGEYFNVLGHSNITNQDSFDLVTSSSSTIEKLLKALGRITSSMNDTLSFGLGTLISLFQNGLTVIGLGDLVGHVSNIFNFITAPVDTANFNTRFGSSSIGSLYGEISSIDLVGHTYNPEDIVIRWNLTSIYPSAVGSFNLSDVLDETKSTWQPLLLTFIYASMLWHTVKSVPNLLNGVTSVKNDIGGRINDK